MNAQPEEPIKLLFLHPTPGLDRHQSYSEACKLLMDKRYEVIFAYNGPPVEGLRQDVTTYHFDSWCQSREAEIRALSVLDLERRYPQSNLWLAIVSERKFANYSLLENTFPTQYYPQEELEFFLKAVVLFYQELIDRHQIQVIFAQHPDNVHSTVLFEMGLSLPVVNFLSFPDYYWTQTSNFAFDTKHFISNPMLATYRDNLAHYDEKVAPREEEVKAFLAERIAKDPSKVRPKLFPKQSLIKNILGSWRGLRRKQMRTYWRRPPIVEGYGQIHLPTSMRAWVRKNWFVRRLRVARYFSDTLPEQPFVYFPLQKVPEAAMLVRASSYLNQQSLAQVLSAALPAGYKLVIKDHPRSMGIHPPAYYKKLLELPNVVIVKPGLPNEELLDRCALLVTIGGTLGYQQLMRGRPVIMFGHKFYECLEGAVRVDDLNELPYVLKDMLMFGKRPDAEAMRRSLFSYILTNLDHKFEAEDVAYALHFNPAAMSDLLDRMIRHEIWPLYQQRVREFG